MASLIFFNQLGYWLAFEAMHTQIKREVRKQLEHKNELEEIIIPTKWLTDSDNGEKNNFIWVKPKIEFKYNNNMYDVSSSYQKGDSTYYRVYNDKDETKLYQAFAFQLKENKNPFHQNKPVYPLKNFIKEALILSEINLLQSFDSDFISILPKTKWRFSIKEFSCTPNSPPPIV
ncbi:hypothetical protein Fleli_4002 [Bernardetia litoralis DSM 6794]|uniref:Uncharacterized protein n=2 Tax=Bernardetia litoralis TaxID=999 RepID=I4AQR9_BERLS|nr:hypothetical protein Fleli_4002 [Bernardetia litoralis DSM 6794]